jgi:ABC-2 type transport system ATP-binding protein
VEKIISVKNLSKEFSFKKDNKKTKITAVDNISFDVNRGETIALIGPNGAGKSTTIKMMLGILHPTKGEIEICGNDPTKQRRELAYKIGSVFGQRSQLSYHLPPKDSFLLFQKVYDIDDKAYKKRIERLIELFEISDFIDQPVRKLSLGQRMRCEIISSLLHRPEIVFLDEPTIGLDVVAKRKLRDVLKKLNEEWCTTIFLTSHDTADIEVLCEKTIIINQGKLIYEDSTQALQQEHIDEKRSYVRFEEETKYKPIEGVDVTKSNNFEIEVKVDTKKLSIKKFLVDLVSKYKVIDINIEDPSLEEIISNIYEGISCY